MQKRKVIRFYGGVAETARAMGVTTSAVSQWPDRLSKRLADQVIGRAVAVRGVNETRKAFPAQFERP